MAPRERSWEQKLNPGSKIGIKKGSVKANIIKMSLLPSNVVIIASKLQRLIIYLNLFSQALNFLVKAHRTRTQASGWEIDVGQFKAVAELTLKLSQGEPNF